MSEELRLAAHNRKLSLGSAESSSISLAAAEALSDEKNERKESRAAKLKRTLSGKLLAKEVSQSKIEQEAAKNVDDSLHKLIRSGISASKLKRILKRHPTAVDTINDLRQTPLHVCAASGLTDHMEMLLRFNANINTQDERGFTPLHYAALEKKLHAVEALLQHDSIDVTLCNQQKTTALHYLVRVLVDEDTLVYYRKIIEMFIRKGINVNGGNTQGESPLHSAILANNRHAVALLLERGADCNLKTGFGETSLHYAARSGNTKIVRMLMEVGADPTVSCKSDNTPIDVASQYNFNEVLDCFLSIIADEIEQTYRLRSTGDDVEMRVVKTNKRLKEGAVQVFNNGEWASYQAVLYPKALVFFTDESCSVDVDFVNLSRASIHMDEGTSFNENSEQVWSFTLQEERRTISVAVRSEEVLESWYKELEKCLGQVEQLKHVYSQLQKLESPRKAKRQKYRREFQMSAMEGSMSFHYAMKRAASDKDITAIILESPVNAIACMGEIISVENDDFFHHFCRFCMHHGHLDLILKSAISHEIYKTNDGSTLFREMNFAGKLLSTYLDFEEGKKYLKYAVNALVRTVSNFELGSLEVNPKNCDGRVDLSENLQKVFDLSQAFLDHILNTGNHCPLIFREILAHTKAVMEEVYPNMTNAVIGSFVFLRYFCPAIVSPHKYGLLQKPPDSHKQRAFVLISKLLQSVSNGVEFDGSKEDYMRKLNPFIQRNRLYVDVFFDNLTNLESIAKQREDEVGRKLRRLTRDELDHSVVVIATSIRQVKEKLTEVLNQYTMMDKDEESCGDQSG